MMLADADEIDARLIGQNRLFDEIADDLRAGLRPSVRPVGDVAEGVESEFDDGSLLWRYARASGRAGSSSGSCSSGFAR